jgi:hypothetical protein
VKDIPFILASVSIEGATVMQLPGEVVFSLGALRLIRSHRLVSSWPQPLRFNNIEYSNDHVVAFRWSNLWNMTRHQPWRISTELGALTPNSHCIRQGYITIECLSTSSTGRPSHSQFVSYLVLTRDNSQQNPFEGWSYLMPAELTQTGIFL